MASEAARIISNGILKLDGGSIFGATSKEAWENSVNADRKNRITLELNRWMLQVNGKNDLIDAGDGSKDNNRDEVEG